MVRPAQEVRNREHENSPDGETFIHSASEFRSVKSTTSTRRNIEHWQKGTSKATKQPQSHDRAKVMRWRRFAVHVVYEARTVLARFSSH